MSRFSSQVHSAATEDEEDGEDERVARMLSKAKGRQGPDLPWNTLKVMRKNLEAAMLNHVYENKTIT